MLFTILVLFRSCSLVNKRITGNIEHHTICKCCKKIFDRIKDDKIITVTARILVPVTNVKKK